MPEGQIPWLQLALWGGQTCLLVALVLAFLIKVAPTWEKIKLQEIEVRKLDIAARSQEAAAGLQIANGIIELGKGLAILGESQEQVSTVLRDVAVEQRKATEVIEILQRYQADSNDQLAYNVRVLTDRVEKIEEKYVQPERTGAGPH